MSDQNLVNRRDFVKTAGSAVAATSLLGADAFAQAPAGRKRYAIIGTGERATGMWGRQIRERYSDVVEFVGLVRHQPQARRGFEGADGRRLSDVHELRRDDRQGEARRHHGDDEGFARTATTSCARSTRGFDVMTEKPMVIDEKQCQAVLDAEKRNKKKIIVTFNYRFAPKHRTVKEILMSGEIGKVLSVDFAWYLDVYHGADYFRRWHAYKNGGGSLWVHKATHHFDLVNWWLGADPVEVVANGQLQVYGKNGTIRGTNCRVCPHKKECQFYYDINTNPTRMRLYAAAEDADGYYRDGCVYRNDIDIYDSMQAIVKYSNGATMAYSLDAHMPFEGYPRRVQRRAGPPRGARPRAAAVGSARGR